MDANINNFEYNFQEKNADEFYPEQWKTKYCSIIKKNCIRSRCIWWMWGRKDQRIINVTIPMNHRNKIKAWNGLSLDKSLNDKIKKGNFKLSFKQMSRENPEEAIATWVKIGKRKKGKCRKVSSCKI